MMWSPTLSSSLTLNAQILTVLTLKLSQIELNVLSVCVLYLHANMLTYYTQDMYCACIHDFVKCTQYTASLTF